MDDVFGGVPRQGETPGDAALARFSTATRAWFGSRFRAPTQAQAGAWRAISSGEHALVVAPTGSGKTLAAFLWAIDRLISPPPGPVAQRPDGCRVVYVSPLKALATDVERNLRVPLAGIRAAAADLGLDAPDVRLAVRSGDTPPEERRRYARDPSDILITTPESLYLLLTSAARRTLAGIETVILDEVHAVAGTKRGAHLAVSLERLDALLKRPAQRIGLSATVRPLDEVARFLGGGRPVTVVAPEAEKRWDLRVVVPVPDLASPGRPAGAGPDPQGSPRGATVWPDIEERIAELVGEHRATLVFTNGRRVAETLTARLNEIAATRVPPDADPDAPPPLLARAHHGSVSREQRALAEEALKAGALPAVVATSSLELGIDMGAIDLVVQVGAPPSVASGLQRVGRAGHQVGAVSRGIFFPTFRGDLVASAVIVERMRAGAIEALAVPSNPLDVLAQQIVAMVALDDWTVDDLESVIRRAAPFTGLTRGVLASVLDMLAGRYPSDAFTELRPRLTWDRTTGMLTARRGSQRVAVTSGGTIPDRGLFGVFVVGEGAGRRVGELDEEMVYESRVGDVITLGTSTWRIEEITHDQVLVSPAPGQSGRPPFWKGDTLGRPAELGAAQGAFLRTVTSMPDAQARARLEADGLDAWAADNLVGYLADQRGATGVVPTDRTLVIERFTDQMGDHRVVLHTPFGNRVHAPWALALGARLGERFGFDAQVLHGDDGIMLRLPGADAAGETGASAQLGPLAPHLLLDPDEVADLVTAELGSSALFAARFRECAGRALLLPNRRPGRRQALWAQRLRSAQLLQVASQFPNFPIVLEAVRECLSDVFDLPALTGVLARVATGEIGVVEVTTDSPSPFAASMMFGYTAQFFYDEDQPLAERRAAALAIDPDLLAEVLGTSSGLALRDLLDPASIDQTARELGHLTASRAARDADDLADVLRTLGPLTVAGLRERSRAPQEVAGWLAGLAASGRAFAFGDRWAAAEDAGRLRDALGIEIPEGTPEVFTEPVPDPLGDLIVRYARTHGPFDADAVAAWAGLGRAIVREGLRRLVAEGRLVEGEFRPTASGREWCDPGVLRTLRRRSVAALRREIEPVPAAQFGRFLPDWQGVGSERRGLDGLLATIEQLAGTVLPASALEPLVLASRVRDYSPALLDELCAGGEVVWRGHGALTSRDGWVSLWPSDLAPPAAPEAGPEGEAETALLEALEAGGASFFGPLSAQVGAGAAEALWSLVWKGLVTNDTFAPVRARLEGGGAGPRTVRAPGRTRASRPRRVAAPRRELPRALGGRWWPLPAGVPDPTRALVDTADLLLERHGVLTRGSVLAEAVPGGFTGVYRVLAAGEESGRLRRGYFIEGLGAAQFATTAAIDRLRAATASAEPQAQVLAACDPANPYGAALGWPPGDRRPGRKAGALVVLVDGALVAHLERDGRTVTTWSAEPPVLRAAADALAALVRDGRVAGLAVERIDGLPALGGGHPFADALLAAGFHPVPQGLRLRR